MNCLKTHSPFRLWLTLLIVALLPATAVAADWNITSLMAELAKNRGGLTAFTETKHIALLDQPLESSGELRYSAPNYLEKRTLLPKLESFVLDGDTVTIIRGSKKRTLKLRRHPKIAIFIESIRGTLAGDQIALERSYQLQLVGSPAQWELTLLPNDKRMHGIISNIAIHGQQGKIDAIEIHQADGDYSIMTIKEAATP